MRRTVLVGLATALLSVFVVPAIAADADESSTRFVVPAVWENDDVVRLVNSQHAYVRETVSVTVENVSPVQQTKYYVPFDRSVFGRIGNFQAGLPGVAERYSTKRIEQTDGQHAFFEVELPPLEPTEKHKFSIGYSILNSTRPLPATIEQGEAQHLYVPYSTVVLSAYTTRQQKTTVRPPARAKVEYSDKTAAVNAADSSAIHGPVADTKPFTVKTASVRYAATHPIVYVSLLERDLELSHWGNNLAVQERYSINNIAAGLKQPFSRPKYTTDAHRQVVGTDIRVLRLLPVGAIADGYHVDAVGNVTTLLVRAKDSDRAVDVQPRYPVFGGWNYNFTVGWNLGLSKYLKQLPSDQGEGYIFAFPFLEGIHMPSGIQYKQIKLRLILPEGAEIQKVETGLETTSSRLSHHTSYLDTIGRTTLTIEAENVTDEKRNTEVVITYTYPWTARVRKPVYVATIVLGVVGLLVGLVQVDVSIRPSRFRLAGES